MHVDLWKIVIAGVVLLVLFTLIIWFAIPGGRHYRKRRIAKRVYGKIQGLDDRCVILYLRKIDPYVFEELVLVAFRKKGYRVYRNRRYSGDGGVDGMVRIGGRKVLIQDKRYQQHICLAHVEAFDEVCRQRKAHGLFIHTGRTGQGSKEVAWNSPRLDIISGDRLIALMKKGRPVEFEKDKNS